MDSQRDGRINAAAAVFLIFLFVRRLIPFSCVLEKFQVHYGFGILRHSHVFVGVAPAVRHTHQPQATTAFGPRVHG